MMPRFNIKEQIQGTHHSANNCYNEMQTICEAMSNEGLEINYFEENEEIFNDVESQPELMVLLDFEEVNFLIEENKELKALISDYHRGIETIMKVFRKMVFDNMKEKVVIQTDKSRSEAIFLQDIIMRQSHQIHEMHEIMKKAAAIDDKEECLIIERISYLRKENIALRELYDINKRIGLSELQINKKDQFSQTDEPLKRKNVECDIDNDNDDVITVVSMDMTMNENENENGEDEDDEWKEALNCPV